MGRKRPIQPMRIGTNSEPNEARHPTRPVRDRRPIGAGGMGEVYRARDPRLGRDVAIKVLPAAFSADADRLHRFEQEARAAAALNHPNILAVYDIGTDGGAPFIVSELLEGETLRERLRGRAARRCARRSSYAVADRARPGGGAREGHRPSRSEAREPVHHDGRSRQDSRLRPGEADQRSRRPRPASALQTAPPLTEPGMVLGTVGYMAPEQVRGLAVDHRADIFAFGAILYEMLSGRRAFRRDTAPETMAAILNEDPPDLVATDRSIPPALARIVDRCLEKNPAARFQTASDLAFALRGAVGRVGFIASASSLSRPPVRRGREWLAWAIAALLLLALAPLATSTSASGRRRPARCASRFRRPSNWRGREISACLRTAAIWRSSGVGADGIAAALVRAMDSLEVRPLPVRRLPSARQRLRRSGRPTAGSSRSMPAASSRSWTCPAVRRRRCAICRRGRRRLVESRRRHHRREYGGGLLRVRETGGAASPVTALDTSRKEEFHLLPSFLPDGRHFVYLRVSPSAPETSGTYVGTLDAKPDEQSTQRLMPYAVGLTYAPAGDSGPGRLLFLREGTLMAQPFDAKRLALAGNPVPVAERVGSFRDGGFFSASANDVLVYRTADTDFQLTWFDRQGTCPAAPRNRRAFAARLFLLMARARSRRGRTRRMRQRPTCGCSICRAAAAPHD